MPATGSSSAPTRSARRPRRLVRPIAVGVTALAVAVTAACGASTGTAASSSASASSAAAAPASSASYTPVTFDDCGHKVTFTAPPQRVVTVKSTSTELLLALGLGDRIVGEAFQDGPVAAQWAAQAKSIPVLASELPSQEAVLDKDPDFVFAGWESNFAADGIGTRDELEKLGIKTFVSPPACKEKGYMPTHLTFDDVFAQTTDIGEIFGVPDRAAAINKQQTAQLAGIHKPARKITALWWSSGDDVPYVGAGDGLPELVMETIGLTNIAANVHDTWTSMGWEPIIAADPDVIILVDASWNPASAKIKTLETDPATKNLTAVRNHRFLTVPFPAAEAGVRSASAAVDLSRQLAALRLS